MKMLDVRGRDLRHLALPEVGQDEALDHATVVVGRARLVAPDAMLAEEPVAQLGHARRLARPVPVVARVPARSGIRQPLARDLAGLLHGQPAMGADGRSPLPTVAGSVVAEIRAAAGGRDLAAEAGDLAVPEDHVTVRR